MYLNINVIYNGIGSCINNEAKYHISRAKKYKTNYLPSRLSHRRRFKLIKKAYLRSSTRGNNLGINIAPTLRPHQIPAIFWQVESPLRTGISTWRSSSSHSMLDLRGVQNHARLRFLFYTRIHTHYQERRFSHNLNFSSFFIESFKRRVLLSECLTRGIVLAVIWVKVYVFLRENWKPLKIS